MVAERTIPYWTSAFTPEGQRELSTIYGSEERAVEAYVAVCGMIPEDSPYHSQLAPKLFTFMSFALARGL